VSTSERDGAIARRTARISEHIRSGKTVGEICDIEGLDPANEPKRMRREVADPQGLVIVSGRNEAQPVGLMDIDRLIRGNLKRKLVLLRDRHHYADVAQMVGLTNIEQKRAIDPPYTHNWTLAQIQRLAVASKMTFEEMLSFMQTPYAADFRKKI